jgi:hypothetical protein
LQYNDLLKNRIPGDFFEWRLQLPHPVTGTPSGANPAEPVIRPKVWVWGIFRA